MILFPFRAQVRLHRWPVFTLLVSLVCLIVYVAQSQSEARVAQHAERACAQFAAEEDKARAAAAEAARGEGAEPAPAVPPAKARGPKCQAAVLHIHYDPHPEWHLDWHVRHVRERAGEEAAARLEAQYRYFAAGAPVLLTARLWHDRSRFDPIGMITSSFAHGSWEHVIFNLLFFFAFAATVELILGPVLFLVSIVAISLGLGGIDHLISHWQGHRDPSLGLSGVVTGMLALFVYFLPRAKIRFFFWFMITIGTIGIPAWIVALWYLGWDLFYQLSDTASRTNFIAHLAGGAMGFLLGATVFSARRHWAREIVVDQWDPKREESWFEKFNAMWMAPAVLGFGFLGSVVVLGYFALFVGSYSLQLLLAAPIAVGVYHLWSTRRQVPDLERFRRGEQALQARQYDEARKHLMPLAGKNYPRALAAMGDLHATGHGVLRDDALALQYYRRAAERGHAPAHYRLGTFYADGRGVERNIPLAVEHYQKAAEGAVPEAAMSLAYLYENGAGTALPADREQAIEWYYRAGVAFHKLGQQEDAEAVVRHLDSLARHYPAVLGLLAKLKGRLAVTKR